VRVRESRGSTKLVERGDDVLPSHIHGGRDSWLRHESFCSGPIYTVTKLRETIDRAPSISMPPTFLLREVPVEQPWHRTAIKRLLRHCEKFSPNCSPIHLSHCIASEQSGVIFPLKLQEVSFLQHRKLRFSP